MLKLDRVMCVYLSNLSSFAGREFQFAIRPNNIRLTSIGSAYESQAAGVGVE